VATKATFAEAIVAGKVAGIVTWAVQVALGMTGVTQTVAQAALLLLVPTDTSQLEAKLTCKPTELPPTCSSPWPSGPRVSSADSYTSWSESEPLNTGESEA
jgi:hypothetical protein